MILAEERVCCAAGVVLASEVDVAFTVEGREVQGADLPGGGFCTLVLVALLH